MHGWIRPSPADAPEEEVEVEADLGGGPVPKCPITRMPMEDPVKK
jgi:hypothetical protein